VTECRDAVDGPGGGPMLLGFCAARSAVQGADWGGGPAGRQEGALELVDLGAAACTEAVAAHTGAVWSLAPLPDQSGTGPHSLPF